MTGNTTAAIVKSSKDEIVSTTSSSSSPPSPIFHVLFLPGGNIQKDTDESNSNNTPNVIIDDYLYERHVYRKKAEARLLRQNNGAAVKSNAETQKHENDLQKRSNEPIALNA